MSKLHFTLADIFLKKRELGTSSFTEIGVNFQKYSITLQAIFPMFVGIKSP